MPDSDHARRLTRRQLLVGAGGAAAAGALGGGAYGASRLLSGAGKRATAELAVPARDPIRTFRSRPDLRPAAVTITGNSADPGHLFFGPGSIGGSQSGPLIVDSSGEPVWCKPLPWGMWGTNFTVSHYDGQPVLIWWEGEVLKPVGYGCGEGVIVDSAYRQLGRVRAANGRRMDMHEFLLTPEGTALFTCFPRQSQADLSTVGGPRRGRVLESIIQEVDVRTGRLLMEWRSLEHIPVSESFRPLEHPYDYLHANSIDIAPDGHLLVSARHAWTLYKLDRGTGEVLWRIGGKRSDFRMASGAQFAWQHDARQVDERTITVFDNGSDGDTDTESQSRTIVLDVDTSAMTVQPSRAYTLPKPLLCTAMGSARILPDGNVLVGCGSQPYVSEFAADGTLVADAAMAAGQQSYRAFRFPWTGAPFDRPAIAATRDPRTGRKTLYASWNGSTEVTHWQVRAGPAASRISPLAIAERAGFETAIPLEAEHGYAAVTALDTSARALATSPTIRL